MTTISDQSAVYSTVSHHLALSETPRGVGTKDQVIFVVETRGKKSLICCVEFLTGQKHLSAQNQLLLSIIVFTLLQKHLLENYFGCIIEKIKHKVKCENCTRLLGSW